MYLYSSKGREAKPHPRSPGCPKSSPLLALSWGLPWQSSCSLQGPVQISPHCQTWQGSWGARRATGMLLRSVQALECPPAPLPCLSVLSPHCKANFASPTLLLFTGDGAKSKVVELKASRDWVQCLVPLHYLSFLRLPRGFWEDADKIQWITWAVPCSRGLANRRILHKHICISQGWDDTGLWTSAALP